MGETARRPATYQDVLNAPEHMVAEVLDGELYLSPRPAPRHAFASTTLSADLRPVMRRRGGSGGWLILFEPELHLQADIIVPDLAGWRIERMPHLPGDSFFTVTPDWVCEVLSPGTIRRDRTKKMRIYARSRVEWLWMVDPIAQTLEVYRLAGEFWQQLAVYGGAETARIPPFEELELDIGAWWAEPEVEPEKGEG